MADRSGYGLTGFGARAGQSAAGRLPDAASAVGRGRPGMGGHTVSEGIHRAPPSPIHEGSCEGEDGPREARRRPALQALQRALSRRVGDKRAVLNSDTLS